ncbi:hypothetical protein PVAG01_06168 [Phlyctema vagabunda]|uniref:Tat pathway signal sequence n=1 Tax=Phlyctema vagabunda TaxID=108571 RepID=A0ABR4PFC1_9HELO
MMDSKYEQSSTGEFGSEIKMDEESLLDHATRSISKKRPSKIYQTFVPSFSSRGWSSVENFGASFQSKLRQFRESITLRAVLFHLIFTITYTSIITFILIPRTQCQSLQKRKSVIYTPADIATVQEAKTISVKINETSNPYNGAPSPEVDQAWSDLFQHANIRVPKEELDRTGRSSVQLADGSGDYLGSLDVYHQLHCLKYIRHYVHQDYYTLGKTNVPNVEHVNHCIEMLRQIVMCKADTALMTYEWLPDFPGPWPNFGIQHEYIFDPQFLQHPKFGFSYAHLVGLPSSNKTE